MAAWRQTLYQARRQRSIALVDARSVTVPILWQGIPVGKEYDQVLQLLKEIQQTYECLRQRRRRPDSAGQGPGSPDRAITAAGNAAVRFSAIPRYSGGKDTSRACRLTLYNIS